MCVCVCVCVSMLYIPSSATVCASAGAEPQGKYEWFDITEKTSCMWTFPPSFAHTGHSVFVCMSVYMGAICTCAQMVNCPPLEAPFLT